MDVWVFSDESGTFDYIHHDIFVYGGMIIPDKQELDNLSRKYTAMERNLRKKAKYKMLPELKASILDGKDCKRLLSIFNTTMKFAVVIHEKKLDVKRIFADKKSKQRYLDFAYKIALKRAFEELVARGTILPSDTFSIKIHEDNHHTSTASIFSKEESIFTEFKEGIFRSRFASFIPPIFENLQNVSINLHDSMTNALIRGADIISNSVYVSVIKGEIDSLLNDDTFHIEILP